MAACTREALWLSESSMDFPFHTGYLPYWLLYTTYNQGLTSTHFFVLAHPTDARPPDPPQCLPTTSATTATTHSLLSPEPKDQEMSMFRGTQENGLAFLAPWFDIWEG